MIVLKGTIKFFDFYREDKIDIYQTQYIPKTTDVKEVILNTIRFNCQDPVMLISEIIDKFNENKIVIQSNKLQIEDSVNSELCFKFSKYDTVIVLCDIDISNRLIISISTSY